MKNRGITGGFLFVSLLVLRDVRAQTCAPDFTIVPTPNGPQHNRLKAVAGFDANDVWAVGFTNGSSYQTLVEHWDGSSWPALERTCWLEATGRTAFFDSINAPES